MSFFLGGFIFQRVFNFIVYALFREVRLEATMMAQNNNDCGSKCKLSLPYPHEINLPCVMLVPRILSRLFFVIEVSKCARIISWRMLSPEHYQINCLE